MSYNFDEDMKANSFDVLAAACDALTETQKPALESLLDLHGIASSFIEYSGQRVPISLLDRWDVLQLKGVDLLTDAQLDSVKLKNEVRRLQESQWLQCIAPVIVLNQGIDNSVDLRFSREQLHTVHIWKIQWEGGQTSESEFTPSALQEQESADIGGEHISARRLYLSELETAPLGYHELTIATKDVAQNALEKFEITSSLIIAPQRCYEPDWSTEGRRVWGFSVQLYSVRSESNWGMGDFSDLSRLVSLSSSCGAGFLALNPLHALDPQRPEECSPYSPNDRRRLNILYIDPTVEPEYSGSESVQKLVSTLAWEKSLFKIKEKTVIDYRMIAQKKRQVLALMFAYFLKFELAKKSTRAKHYMDFVKREGESLNYFAGFEVERDFARGTSELEKDPRFVLYTQWLADGQLTQCQVKAKALGLSIGLIRDLAVGSSAGGAEIGQNSDLFCTQTSVGAPPDPLAPQGQNWGLPPMDPMKMRASGYRHFINLLRTNMASCGALRIDHVMALMRLWWCPRFPGRGHGSYVAYPVAELFSILRLESQRNRCVVIGEDLGVVPPEIRQYLDGSGIYSNVLFYFEKYDGHHFKRPEDFKEKALAMVANHDVPTLAAWWNSADLTLRRNLELIENDDELSSQLSRRDEERKQILHLLQNQWLAPSGWTVDNSHNKLDYALCAAIFRLCARSKSQLVSIQLEDLVLYEMPVNIPGTCSEYPNWQRKLPVSLEEIFATAGQEKLLEGFLLERG